MYSLEDLLISFIVASAYIYVFKLQKELFNNKYWSTSDIIDDIDQAPSFKLVFIRFLIVLIYGLFLNIFLGSKVILFGMTLGSFLIVWPVFLNEENIEPGLLEKKLTLRTLMAFFVIVTFLIAKLSIVLFVLFQEAFNMYITGFNYKRFINLIGDSIIWLTFIAIFKVVISYFRKQLDKKIYLAHEDYSLYNEKDNIDQGNEICERDHYESKIGENDR